MGKKIGAGAVRGSGGYLSSAVAFAAITAIWAFIVRSDPYYRAIDLLGVRAPLGMMAYLVAMPLAGLAFGVWRYDRAARRGGVNWLGKLAARAVQFTYAHLLLVLFTVAMAADYFLGLNIDQQVRRIDDRLFDMAARFAPWLAAYLAGYNLGRALRGGELAPAVADADTGNLFVRSTAQMTAEASHAPAARETERRKRADPPVSEAFESREDDRGDLAYEDFDSPVLGGGGGGGDVHSGVEDEPGFLPPQDIGKLRPTLQDIR